MTNVGKALQWHLEKLGKFEGANIGTIRDENGYQITQWECEHPKPTDAELAQIVSDYEAVLADRLSQKQAIIDKLGLTEQEVNILLNVKCP